MTVLNCEYAYRGSRHTNGQVKRRRIVICGVTAMSTEAVILSLISTLLGGGVLGAIIKELFARGKTRAEEKKTEAEAERTKAEAERIKIETADKLRSLNLKASPVVAMSNKEPKGWSKAGADPGDYDVGLDENELFRDKSTCFIKARQSPRGFATLMQMIKADAFRGKRVRLTGNAKSEQVGEWAGFWMRVDGPKAEQRGFDNMQDRPITGTTGWTKYQVVLDVPDDSAHIAFGLLLGGPGQVWMADLQFEVVSSSVPTTDLVTVYPDKPVNLAFDE
jgi:hypothetical protein